jgi:uncharacterized protein YbjT (DUF2867 family)
MTMRALLVGATGATGKDVLDLLLEDDHFDRVDIFVRRDIEQRHEKLHVHVIDFEKPEEWTELLNGDVLFSCLGTTLKAAGSKETQWRIDYDYQYEFAKAASENGVDNYILVSSSGASPDSILFYSKMKGRLEDAVRSLRFRKLAIFRPPILERKGSDRSGEVLGVKAIRLLNRLGLLRSQRPMPTAVLARAMINSAKAQEEGAHVYSAEMIWEMSENRM